MIEINNYNLRKICILYYLEIEVQDAIIKELLRFQTLQVSVGESDARLGRRGRVNKEGAGILLYNVCIHVSGKMEVISYIHRYITRRPYLNLHAHAPLFYLTLGPKFRPTKLLSTVYTSFNLISGNCTTHLQKPFSRS